MSVGWEPTDTGNPAARVNGGRLRFRETSEMRKETLLQKYLLPTSPSGSPWNRTKGRWKGPPPHGPGYPKGSYNAALPIPTLAFPDRDTGCVPRPMDSLSATSHRIITASYRFSAFRPTGVLRSPSPAMTFPLMALLTSILPERGLPTLRIIVFSSRGSSREIHTALPNGLRTIPSP